MSRRRPPGRAAKTGRVRSNLSEPRCAAEAGYGFPLPRPTPLVPQFVARRAAGAAARAYRPGLLFPLATGTMKLTAIALAATLVTESYAADRGVVQQGEPGDRFYIIARGKVRVTQLQPDGQDATVAVLDDGDYFGEAALLGNVPRNATVTTVGACVFLSLGRRQFTFLLERAPQILTRLRQRRPVPAAPDSAGIASP